MDTRIISRGCTVGMNTMTRWRSPELLGVAALAYARAHVVGMCVDGRARGYRAPAGAMGLCERSYDCEIQVCTELPRNTFYTVRVLLQTGGSGGYVRWERSGGKSSSYAPAGAFRWRDW